MASPHVAGAAALLAAIGQTDPATIRQTLIDAGNFNWSTNYEVLVPITIHDSEIGGSRGAIGIAIGWQGHNGTDQPMIGHPYQAIAFLRDVTTSPVLAAK